MATHTVTLHMLVSGAWLDITRLDDNTRVLADDQGAQSIMIVRGRQDEQGAIAPTTVDLRYLDRLNVLDGQNPNSPYYDLIAPSTPVRVTVDGNVRAEVELASLRTTSVPSGEEIEVIEHALASAGQRLRLEGARKPRQSAATRRYRREQPWQWWAMEKGPGVQVTSIPSSIPSRRPDVLEARTDLQPLRATPASAGGVENARTSGVVSGDTTTGPPGAAGAVNVSGGGQLQANFTINGPSLGLNTLIVEGAFQFASPVDDLNAGQIVRLNLTPEVTIGLFAQPESITGPLVFSINSSSELIDQSNDQVVPDDGSWHHVVMIFERVTGISFNFAVYIDGVAYFSSATTATALLDITQFTLSPTGELGAVSQWAIWKDGYEPEANLAGWTAISGFSGLTPDEVVESLFTEYGVETGNNSDMALFNETIFITALQAGSLMDQVDAAADAGQHLIVEKRDEYDQMDRVLRTSRYNRMPTATITYQQLVGDLAPVQDAYDGRIVNDYTASNNEGDEERYVIPDDDPWHWTTQQPPAGVGVRDQAGTFPVTASNLRQLAAWIAHERSWKEKRWVNISVNLSKVDSEYPDTGFSAAEIAALRALDVGHVLAVDSTDSPAYVPYNELRLSIQGYTEIASKFLNVITFNATPADIWEVEVTEFGPTAVIANVIDADDTTVRLAPGDGPAPSNTEEDFHISINGDPMTVTAISTMTPAYIATGAAAYADNASVAPALPAGITPDVGQLLLIFAGAHGTGTADPVCPAGWTEIAVPTSGEVKLFGRYYVTGDTAPTVALLGGSAGVTLGAQMAAFSGLSMTLDKNLHFDYPESVFGARGSQNSSAQDMVYLSYRPRRASSAVLLLGKKNDDWTGVATPAGWTEVGDSSSTLGNDMGMAWYFDVDAGAVLPVAAGSLVVTGGAAATSQTAVIGLRPLQTLTVTRDIAGVATSHTPGQAVHVWRPGAVAL